MPVWPLEVDMDHVSTPSESGLASSLEWARVMRRLVLRNLDHAELPATRSKDEVGKLLESVRVAIRPFVPPMSLPAVDRALDRGGADDISKVVAAWQDWSPEAESQRQLMGEAAAIADGWGDASDWDELKRIEELLPDLSLLEFVVEGMAEQDSGNDSSVPDSVLWAYVTLLARGSELLGPLQRKDPYLRENIMQRSLLANGALLLTLRDGLSSGTTSHLTGRDLFESLSEYLLAQHVREQRDKQALHEILDRLVKARVTQFGFVVPPEAAQRRAQSEVASLLIRLRPRYLPGPYGDEFRSQVREWLITIDDGALTSPDVLKVAANRAQVERGLEFPPSLPEADVAFTHMSADAEVDGLLTWLLISDNQLDAVSHSAVETLLRSGTSISSDALEVWRNEIADIFYLERNREDARSLLAGLDPSLAFSGLPTRVLPMWFSVYADAAARADEVTAGGSRDRHKDRWWNVQTALIKLWGDHMTLVLPFLSMERKTVVLEEYFEALKRKRVLEHRLARMFKDLKNSDIPRTPRMWEARLATLPTKNPIEPKLLNEITEDLAGRPYTAGLWTTIIGRGLSLDKGTSGESTEDSDERVDEAIARGEGLMNSALSELGGNARQLEDADRWFSEREARFLLASYPRQGAYATMPLSFNSAINAASIDEVASPSFYTSVMLGVLASGHASQGRSEGLERVLQMLDEVSAGVLDEGTKKELWVRCNRAVLERALQRDLRKVRKAAQSQDLESFLDETFERDLAERPNMYKASVLGYCLGRVEKDYEPSATSDRLVTRIRRIAEELGVQDLSANTARDRALPTQETDLTSEQHLFALRSLLRLIQHDYGNITTRAHSKSRTLLHWVQSLDGAVEQASSEGGREQLVDSVREVSKAARGMNDYMTVLQRKSGILRVAAEEVSDASRPSLKDVVERLGSAAGFDVGGATAAGNRSIKVKDLSQPEREISTQSSLGAAQTLMDQAVASFLINTLLDNAETHGEGDVSVRISLSMDGQSVRLLFVDDGDGLQEEVIRMLDALESARDPDRSESAPKGLLSARLTAEAFGGRIEVQDVDGRKFPCLVLPALLAR